MVVVPWSGFDLINAFNAWKRSPRAGRVFAVDGGGVAAVVGTGLVWRGQVHQQVFEEAAVDLGRALSGFGAARRGSRRRGGRVGFRGLSGRTRRWPRFGSGTRAPVVGG